MGGQTICGSKLVLHCPELDVDVDDDDDLLKIVNLFMGKYSSHTALTGT